MDIKKLILDWLIGSDNVQDYMDLLRENIANRKEHLKELNDHLVTLRQYQEDLELLRKVIQICENHGIDVDAEIRKLEP